MEKPYLIDLYKDGFLSPIYSGETTLDVLEYFQQNKEEIEKRF